MSTITWLHLSDLHACNPRHGWDSGRVTETLVDDLRWLQANHGLRPDLLFFTGDAAFGQIGSEGEKTIARQFETFGVFLDAVLGAFEPSIPLENVFLVPGNHDVNRDEVTDDQTEWFDARLEDGEEGLRRVQGLVQGGGTQWRRIMERLDDYRAFLDAYGLDHLLDDGVDGTVHADPSRLIYGAVREVGGVRVGIGGFNSAWSCCRNGERGRLWMAGRWQQGILRRGLRDVDLSIALMHHPPDWLGEHESLRFGRRIEHDFQFMLHGHEHSAWVHATDGYAVVAAAACYEQSEGGKNGYNLVRLDASTGKGEVWLRGFDADGGGWVRRPVANKADDGVWRLALGWLPERMAGSPEAVSPGGDAADPTPGVPSPHPSPEVPSDPQLDAPPTDLERYLQRLRAAHRDLPLSGFKTTVRLPIQIDDVYMPLRARVSPSALHGDRHLGALRALDGLGGVESGLEQDRLLDFDEAISYAREHDLRGVVVLGDPGSGKTTLLKHFVLAATDPSVGPATLGLPAHTVPVLIELRSLSDPTAGLLPALEEAVARADIALEPGSFTSELVKMPLLVLVDGLDEVADEAERAEVSRWLERAVATMPESTFVVTSRYAGYKADARLAGRFLELHVDDVEEEAARRFIRAWYRAVESRPELGLDAEVAARRAGESAADLEQKVFEPDDPRTESLRKLAKNPLMLQILCLVHRDRKRLPERRVQLYSECVEVLLELWRRAKGLELPFDAQEALRLLQPIAYALHVAEEREAPLADLLPHLEAALRELQRDPDDGAPMLEAIRDQSGVLVSLGQGQYGFLHLSFQEYLAALYVQDRHAKDPQVLRDLAERFGDGWWREVILLSLGLNNPALFDPLMGAILDAGALHRDHALADDCLRDALVASPEPLVRALARGIDDADERYHVLRLLKALLGWDEVPLDVTTGLEVVERIAREDQSKPARSLARELLAGIGREVADEAPTHRGAPAILEPASADSGSKAGIRSMSAVRERVHAKDGSVLVHVPQGDYPLGSSSLDLSDIEDEDDRKTWQRAAEPEHTVRLSEYWIGKYPVTNAQYRRFLEQTPEASEPRHWHDKRFNESEQPVVGVSWQDAIAYCRWASLVLPTEAQWEAAARGTDLRPFPWGDSPPTAELANFGGHEGRTSVVGAYPAGAGPFGTLDQAGNVWEWCRDAFDFDAYDEREGAVDPIVHGSDDNRDAAVRVVRGGSWFNPSRFLAAAIRSWYRASDRDLLLGFRVVSVSAFEL
ncbi:MAG: SUMF1/EgtB/PvdO family nonheme iron enzyme [Acidobacteriota bacterium]